MDEAQTSSHFLEHLCPPGEGMSGWILRHRLTFEYYYSSTMVVNITIVGGGGVDSSIS